MWKQKQPTPGSALRFLSPLCWEARSLAHGALHTLHSCSLSHTLTEMHPASYPGTDSLRESLHRPTAARFGHPFRFIRAAAEPRPAGLEARAVTQQLSAPSQRL